MTSGWDLDSLSLNRLDRKYCSVKTPKSYSCLRD
jgi:hypothetical protein